MKYRLFHTIIVALAALLLTIAFAQAEDYVYHSEKGLDCRAGVQDIGADLPQELEEALARAGFGGDPILDGVLCALTSQYLDFSPTESEWAALAVHHGEKTLLLHGSRTKQQERWTPWQILPASESFLPAGEEVELQGLPLWDMRTGIIVDVLPAVCRGRDVYYLTKRSGELSCYLHEDSPGTGVEIRFLGDGAAVARVWDHRTEAEDYAAFFMWPVSVEFWRVEDVPRSIQELRAFEAAHPFPPEGTYARASAGGNFRREPTGSSPILGQFVSASAEVLGSQMGASYPWYHVRVGEIEGWASFPYVNPEHWDGSNERDGWAAVQAVGKAARDEALLAGPGGESQGILPAGTLFHVLLKQGGYFYVAVPQEEIGWMQSDLSEYGWVKTDAVETYASPLQARFSLGEIKLIADP